MFKFIKEWVFVPIAFIVLIPIGVVILCLGFNSCWNCSKIKHMLTMKFYKSELSGRKFMVCKGCHDVLTNRRFR